MTTNNDTAEREAIVRIAKGLTETQRDALLNCCPWDVCVGAGIAIAFCVNEFLEDSTITDEGIQLTLKGQAVRDYLKGEK